MKKTIMTALLTVLVIFTVFNTIIGCVYLDSLVKDCATQRMEKAIVGVYEIVDDVEDVKISGVRRTGLFSYAYCVYYTTEDIKNNQFMYALEYPEIYEAELIILRDVIFND